MGEKAIQEYFPQASEIKQLQPEDIGLSILAFFADKESGKRSSAGVLNRYNFMLAVHSSTLRDAEMEIAEGLHWLDIEGLIADQPGQNSSFIFVTRKGYLLLESADLKSYLTADLLPRISLDPILTGGSRETFRKGKFDIAIFEAYREVEIRVRKACGYGNDRIGTKLMSDAFDPEKGPLTDKEQEAGERQAVRNIFVGIIGLFKNSASHRDIDIDDPHEAASIIQFADYLLKFIERRKHLIKQEDEKTVAEVATELNE